MTRGMFLATSFQLNLYALRIYTSVRNPKVIIWMAGALCNLLKHPAIKALHQMVSAGVPDKKESPFHKTTPSSNCSRPISNWGLSGFVAAPNTMLTSGCATGDPQSV